MKKIFMYIYIITFSYSKNCYKDDENLVFKTDYCLMQVKAIIGLENLLEHSAILWTFIKLPFVIKIRFLSVFEWPLKVLLYIL